MPIIPSEYTAAHLRMFQIVVGLHVPFGSEKWIPPINPVAKADLLIMARLDVEIDGKSHSSLHNARRDDRRDETLKKLGYPTIRFADEDTWNKEKCAHDVSEAIEKLPKVPCCIYSNLPHHHVPMMHRIYCMSARKYLP